MYLARKLKRAQIVTKVFANLQGMAVVEKEGRRIKIHQISDLQRLTSTPLREIVGQTALNNSLLTDSGMSE
jgi:hypothetical protein